jgi:superfamily II DNA helicase RecQ
MLIVIAGTSCQTTRDRLCALLKPGGMLADARSCIIYCTFKEDANQLARLLSVRGVTAQAYHAGRDHRVSSRHGVGPGYFVLCVSPPKLCSACENVHSPGP